MAILDLNDWNNRVAAILEKREDQAEVSQLLVEVTDSYSEMFATHQQTVEENKKLQDANEKLRQVNMDQMIRIGQQLASGGQSFERQKTRAETITFDDLFKEEK